MAYSTQTSTGTSTSTSTPEPSPANTGVYNTKLNFFTDAYNKAIKGYTDLSDNVAGGLASAGQQGLNWLSQGGQNIMQGYGNLSGQVLGGLFGVGREAAGNITNAYKGLWSNQDADFVNRGLSNSTIRGSAQDALQRQENVEQRNNLYKSAEEIAGHQQSLGLAGLGYLGHLNDQQAGYINQTAQQVAGARQAIGGAGLQAMLQANQQPGYIPTANTSNSTSTQTSTGTSGGGGGGGVIGGSSPPQLPRQANMTGGGDGYTGFGGGGVYPVSYGASGGGGFDPGSGYQGLVTDENGDLPDQNQYYPPPGYSDYGGDSTDVSGVYA